MIGPGVLGGRVTVIVGAESGDGAEEGRCRLRDLEMEMEMEIGSWIDGRGVERRSHGWGVELSWPIVSLRRLARALMPEWVFGEMYAMTRHSHGF